MKIKNKLILALGFGLSQPIKAITKQQINGIQELMYLFKEYNEQQTKIAYCCFAMLEIIKIKIPQKNFWQKIRKLMTSNEKLFDDTFDTLEQIKSSRDQDTTREDNNAFVARKLDYINRVVAQLAKEDQELIIDKFNLLSSILLDNGEIEASIVSSSESENSTVNQNPAHPSSSHHGTAPQLTQNHMISRAPDESQTPKKSKPEENRLTQMQIKTRINT